MKAYLFTPPSDSLKSRWQRFVEGRLPTIVISLMVATFVAAVLYPHVVVTVPSGYVGVLWKRFGGLGIYCWCVVGRGTVLDPAELREEGLHIIWPWDRLFLYDLRLQTTTQTYNAIAKDGVNVTATINIRYQLKHNSVAQLHKFIGPAYVKSVVQPEIGTRAREIIANYTAEEVYSLKREEISEAIRQSAQKKLGDQLNDLVQPESSDQFQPQADKQIHPDLRHSIEIFDTLVLGIELPKTVTTAINNKTEQMYIAQEYQFRIDREIKESERKRIEAAGIHDFQQIVSQGISESYLRWRGIEATLQLAQSNNAKIVIVGSGKDGLPIILGNVDMPAPPPVGTSPTAPQRTTTTNGRTPTIHPPMPSETTPAAGLPEPSENNPNGAAPSAGSPGKTQSLLPVTLSEIKALLSQFSGRETATGPKQPSETPTAGSQQ
jgi:regulator of protease activity HflC (stomatin/prohibitin superfamily)